MARNVNLMSGMPKASVYINHAIMKAYSCR